MQRILGLRSPFHGAGLRPPVRRLGGPLAGALAAVVVVVSLAACGSDAPAETPPISPGNAVAPRELNIIMKDYAYLPSVIDVVPGETVLLHVVNGGLEVHEVVIGNMAVQDAWEVAEAATVGAPPGPTPVVTVPAGLEGVRVVARSGERVDVTWTVPSAPAAGASPDPLIIGCHIPGHWAKGMQAPLRFVVVGG
jgi:uncharacterized cupredoxin-like copper-binding protein